MKRMSCHFVYFLEFIFKTVTKNSDQTKIFKTVTIVLFAFLNFLKNYFLSVCLSNCLFFHRVGNNNCVAQSYCQSSLSVLPWHQRCCINLALARHYCQHLFKNDPFSFPTISIWLLRKEVRAESKPHSPLGAVGDLCMTNKPRGP